MQPARPSPPAHPALPEPPAQRGHGAQQQGESRARGPSPPGTKARTPGHPSAGLGLPGPPRRPRRSVSPWPAARLSEPCSARAWSAAPCRCRGLGRGWGRDLAGAWAPRALLAPAASSWLPSGGAAPSTRPGRAGGPRARARHVAHDLLLSGPAPTSPGAGEGARARRPLAEPAEPPAGPRPGRLEEEGPAPARPARNRCSLFLGATLGARPGVGRFPRPRAVPAPVLRGSKAEGTLLRPGLQPQGAWLQG